MAKKQEDSIKFTLKELEKFYICAFNHGFESKLVCGGLGRINEYNDVSQQTLALAIIKAKVGFKDE